MRQFEMQLFYQRMAKFKKLILFLQIALDYFDSKVCSKELPALKNAILPPEESKATKLP